MLLVCSVRSGEREMTFYTRPSSDPAQVERQATRGEKRREKTTTHVHHKMLRPKPNKIELGPEDLEDFKQAQRRQEEEEEDAPQVSAPERSPTVAERIGYVKPVDPRQTNKKDRV
jgi:hypothetical protein